jgi:hypothetical protein
MTCKNCGFKLDGPFCSQCGQNSNVGRINLHNFLNEVSESVFQVNRGFFFTLWELMRSPGQGISEFLEGKRKLYFKPIAYVLTLSTLYFLVAQLSGRNTWIDDLFTGFVSGTAIADENLELPKALTWFTKSYAYSILLLLPIFSLASYLSFFSFGKNYLEHVVINSYVTGQQAIFYSLFTFLEIIVESKIFEFLPLLIAISYAFWVFWQLFPNGSRFVNLLRSMLTYLLYLIFCILVLIVILRF